eukprot:sb/3471609/
MKIKSTKIYLQVTTYFQVDYLLSNDGIRTKNSRKGVAAGALGVSVATLEWLQDSVQANQLLHVESYIPLTDQEKFASGKFDISDLDCNLAATEPEKTFEILSTFEFYGNTEDLILGTCVKYSQLYGTELWVHGNETFTVIKRDSQNKVGYSLFICPIFLYAVYKLRVSNFPNRNEICSNSR